MSATENAIAVANRYHAGQVDKQGLPYILHPLRVGLRGRTELERIVGFLHDTIEDTDLAPGFVRQQFGSEVCDAVLAITRGWKANGGQIYFKMPYGTNTAPEQYMDFIKRCSLNATAKVVKLFDLEDNLARLDGLEFKERESLRNRWLKAREFLREAK